MGLSSLGGKVEEREQESAAIVAGEPLIVSTATAVIC